MPRTWRGTLAAEPEDVSSEGLEAAEIEAIQSAMRESAPRTSKGSADTTPTRLALIADDRTAESARPVLLGLATRTIRSITRGLKPHIPGTWQLDVAGAEIIDGAAVKEELRGGWVGGMRSSDDAELVVVAHGGVIDIAAARRCGASAPTSDTNRAPSALSLRLFQPAGKSVLDACSAAWGEVFSSELAPSADLGMVQRLIEARSVVRVALQFSGGVSGRIQIYARPDGLIARPGALAAFRANAQKIASALSHVQVEVVVELGTLRMKLRELRRLENGSQFTLQNFVDSRVPVYCGGVLKAWARPVVCRGVLAVQIESVVHGQGSRS